jgi:hypothetical protein
MAFGVALLGVLVADLGRMRACGSAVVGAGEPEADDQLISPAGCGQRGASPSNSPAFAILPGTLRSAGHTGG